MSDVWLLLPLLGIALALIMFYKVVVVHWADANDAWEYAVLDHKTMELV